MTKILVPVLLILLLSAPYFCVKTSGKLDQAAASSNRLNVMHRVGESFLQLGSIEAS